MGLSLGRRNCAERLRRPLLVVVAVVVASLGVVAPAYGRGDTTLLAGYVSAGAPVNGARLTAYDSSGHRLRMREKRNALKSDVDGFFLIVLRGHPASVRIVASGGTVAGQRIDGSLQAIVHDPGLARDVFINPASTVIAAYAASRPRASLARATRRARHLLSLTPGDALGQALLDTTPYLDGRLFLERAGTRGGLQRYVAYLIRRGKPVSLRAPMLLGGFEDIASVFSMANNAIGAINGIGTFVNNIIDWVQKPQEKIGQIWEAVQQMQNQLKEIQSRLADIDAEIKTGFAHMQRLIEASVYPQLVQALSDLAGTVESTDVYFQDLIQNATDGHFSAEFARRRTDDIQANIRTIVGKFNEANDLFRNQLLPGLISPKPTFYFDGQALLSSSEDFMTPADSAQLQNFAGYVLQYQALAFNLIVRWETYQSPVVQTVTLQHALSRYLGSVQEAKAWWDKYNPKEGKPVPPTAPPDHGDLHDELEYLATIRSVPAHTIVDSLPADKEHPTGTGLMWLMTEHGPTQFNYPFNFDLSVHFPPGLWCGGNYQPGPTKIDGRSWCPYMWNTWSTATTGGLPAAEKLATTSTGLAGWEPANMAQAVTVTARGRKLPGVQLSSNYWTPSDPAFVETGYQFNCDGYGHCTVCPENTYCGYSGKAIDGVTVKTIETLTGNVGSCTFGVGYRRGTYFPDASHKAACPQLYALLGRKIDPTGERYWP